MVFRYEFIVILFGSFDKINNPFKNNNEYSYLLLLSRKSDMDIFGIVPPPVMDCLFKSLIKDGDRPELVAVGIRFVPYTVSDVLIKLKLISE